MMKTINTMTVQDAVYEQLLEVILSGKIKPGEKLTIEGVAKDMDVSITPVRVALKKLEAGNFINILKNRRIIVNELSKESLNEIFNIRLILECYAAERACINREEETVAYLEKLNNMCEQAHDSDEYLKANYQFHTALYEQAKMPILQNIINSLWQQLSPYLHILLRQGHEKIIHDFDPNHIGIIKAVQEKDQVSVKNWLTEELTNASKLIQKNLT